MDKKPPKPYLGTNLNRLLYKSPFFSIENEKPKLILFTL